MNRVIGIVVFALMCASCTRLNQGEASKTLDTGNNRNVGKRVIWGGMNGGAGATNQVIAPAALPDKSSVTITNVAKMSGFAVYASPVIFEYDGAQYVVVLWANSSELRVVTYRYADDGQIASISFAKDLVFDADPNRYKAHQLAISIENNVPVLYVGHAGGLAVQNAYSGAAIKNIDDSDGAFYVRVSGSNVFYSTPGQVCKYNNSASDANPNCVGVSGKIPNDPLPIVVSGDVVYFPMASAVHKVAIDSFNSVAGTLTLKGPLTHYNQDREQEFVGNMAAYGKDDVIVAKKLVNQVRGGLTPLEENGGGYSDEDKRIMRRFPATRYVRFNRSVVPFGYYTYLASGIYSNNAEINTQLSKMQGTNDEFESHTSTNGDYSHTVLAVSDDTTYLAEIYAMSYALDSTGLDETPFKNDCQNVHKTFPNSVIQYTPVDSRKEEAPLNLMGADRALFGTAFFSGQDPVYVSTPLGPYDWCDTDEEVSETHINYSNRFFVIDGSGKALAIQNINESFFSEKLNPIPIYNDVNPQDEFHPWTYYHQFERTSNILNTYHSQVAIGSPGTPTITKFNDPDDQIIAIAVGRGMVVVSGLNSSNDGFISILD